MAGPGSDIRTCSKRTFTFSKTTSDLPASQTYSYRETLTEHYQAKVSNYNVSRITITGKNRQSMLCS